MKLSKSNFLWGAIFIVAGILFILNEFTSFSIDIFDFWPLFIILPALSSMCKKGIRTGNTLALLIGIAFLLTSLDILDSSIIERLFIPVCLIFVGVVVMFKDKLAKTRPPKWVEEKFDSSKTPSYNATFSTNKAKYPHDTFTGTDINCVFGSVVLDLRDAIVTEDTIVNCYCVFGGVDIFIPQNVNLRISGTPIFGGITNKTPDYENVNAPTLYFNATTLFGGVNIK